MTMDPLATTTRLGPPISVTHRIHAAATTVWAVISAPGYLERCHPFCASTEVESWPGAGSVDRIHYLSGWVYERRFLRWFEGGGYDLEIGGAGEPRSLVSWRVASVADDSSTLTITVRPHVLGRWPAVVRRLAYFAYVRPMLRRYLSSVVRGVDWFVTQGEAVPRNHFGRHPWFSAASDSS